MRNGRSLEFEPSPKKTKLTKNDDKKDTDPYAKLKLMDFKHWSLYLSEKQYPYIGRCVAAAKRQDANFITDGTTEEYIELHDTVIPLWSNAAKKAFGMDRPNMAILGI